MVEVRRLELLTPYMREAEGEEDDPPRTSANSQRDEDETLPGGAPSST